MVISWPRLVRPRIIRSASVIDVFSRMSQEEKFSPEEFGPVDRRRSESDINFQLLLDISPEAQKHLLELFLAYNSAKSGELILQSVFYGNVASGIAAHEFIDASFVLSIE